VSAARNIGDMTVRAGTGAHRPEVPGSRPVAHPVLVSLGLAVGPLVAVGFARFAYGLLLPDMRTALGWSFATAGGLNTANAVGYLLGGLVSGPLAARYEERAAYLAALSVTVVAVAADGASGVVPVLLAVRLIAGVSGAICFTVGASLATRLTVGQAARTSTTVLGGYFAGAAAGIVLSGVLVPVALDFSGWQVGWLALAALSLLLLTAVVAAVRAVPERPGGVRRPAARRVSWPIGRYVPLLLAYGLFGAGYIVYMTFIVAQLRQVGAGPPEVTAFWLVLGVAAVVAAVAWSPVLGVLHPGRGAAVVLATLTVGAMLPLVSTSAPVVFASAVLFGGAFLTVVTAVTTVARRELAPHQWTSSIAHLTVAFALGQCVGPLLSGTLSDGPGGIHTALWLCGGFLVAALVAAMAQRGPVAATEPGTLA
jgi:predicted MFS family arabinose efflux permease